MSNLFSQISSTCQRNTCLVFTTIQNEQSPVSSRASTKADAESEQLTKMVLSMARWKGKVAIVSGASSGIGSAIAQKLVEEGLKVVGLARRVERVDELAKKLCGKPGKLYAVKTDVTKEEDILKAFEWVTKNVGPVSILVNNAGLTQVTSLMDGDTQMWKRILDVNVLGLCIATREAVKIMKANKIDGHIVHINSIVGHYVPASPPMNIYPASKFAVTALTESLRQEFNQSGSKIKITSVSPGVVLTEFAENLTNDKSQIEEFKKHTPMLKPEDIAEAVAYAVSTPPHVQIHELTIRPVGETF